MDITKLQKAPLSGSPLPRLPITIQTEGVKKKKKKKVEETMANVCARAHKSRLHATFVTDLFL